MKDLRVLGVTTSKIISEITSEIISETISQRAKLHRGDHVGHEFGDDLQNCTTKLSLILPCRRVLGMHQYPLLPSFIFLFIYLFSGHAHLHPLRSFHGFD